MATNPVDQHAATPTRVREALAALPVRRRLRLSWPTPTRRASRMSCCPPPAWGEKDGTVTNSERRISRQRALPAAPGRGAARLVDRGRGRAADGLRRGVRLRLARPTIFREHAALSAFENDGSARLRSRRPRRHRRRRLRRARAGAVAASRPAGRAGDGALLRRRALLHRRRPRALRADAAATARRDAGRPSFPLVLNTGRVARPVAHDDAHRRSRRASPRHIAEPFVEIASRRCRAAGHPARDARSRASAARTAAGARVDHRRPAPGRGLRADALDRRIRLQRDHRSTRRSGRPIRSRASPVSSIRRWRSRQQTPLGTASP